MHDRYRSAAGYAARHPGGMKQLLGKYGTTMPPPG